MSFLCFFFKVSTPSQRPLSTPPPESTPDIAWVCHMLMTKPIPDVGRGMTTIGWNQPSITPSPHAPSWEGPRKQVRGGQLPVFRQVATVSVTAGFPVIDGDLRGRGPFSSPWPFSTRSWWQSGVNVILTLGQTVPSPAVGSGLGDLKSGTTNLILCENIFSLESL